MRIAEALRALGYSVWRDDELPAHRSYTEVIEERLKSAKAVLVVWSAEAVHSEWVQSEADRARIDRKLVQVSIDGALPPMPFDRIQFADLRGWRREPTHSGWKKVVESLAALTGSRRSPRQRNEPIDLGREPDFALGAAHVQPSITEVSVGDTRIRLQPRVMQVLVALARAEGEVVSRDDLIASCWGGLAIGDDAINRCVARLRRLSETEAPGAFAIETLPRIGYRLSRVGGAEDGATTSTVRRPRALGRPALAGLAAIVLAAVVWVALGRPGWPARGQGIAVMPFDTPSGDASARQFADGVADEVASSLAKSDLISVSAGAESVPSGLARDALAQRLGAEYTLSGRVQRAAGNALAVSVSLDDAQRHLRVWSVDFTRDAAQAQDLQEEVAAKVANVLHCALASDGQKTASLDLESTRLYLSACDAFGDDDEDDTHVRDLLRELVARQPGFASGWAQFALASALASQELTGDQATAAQTEARQAASRALQINPNEGLAYAALETLAPQTDLAERQRLIEKGLRVSPDVAVLNHRESAILDEVGRVQDAIAFDQRAVAIDPLNPFLAADLAAIASMHGADAAARSMLEQDARIWPHASVIQAFRLGLEARYGDPAVALQMLSNPTSLPPMTDAQLADWRAFALARQSGDKAKIAAYVAQVLANVAGKRLTVGQALVRLVSLDAADAVYEVAAQAPPDDPVETEPFFRSPAVAVRADPRFLPLMAKTGVLAFWRRTGHWADFCDARDRPYDCRAEAAKLGL